MATEESSSQLLLIRPLLPLHGMKEVHRGNNGPNVGEIIWVPQLTIVTGIGVGEGVMLVDIHGDGRVDHVWLHKNGTAKLHIIKDGSEMRHLIWMPQGAITTRFRAVRTDI
jgi:hypothetical protein